MEAIVLLVQCPYCDYDTTTLRGLEWHRSEKHAGVCICPHCMDNKIFKTNVSLKQHLIAMHGYPSDYPCPHCRKYFVCTSTLRNHVDAKHPNPALQSSFHYKCDHCDQRFHRRKALKTHVAVDHKRDHQQKLAEKIFKCSSCSKAFTRQRNLQIHVANNHL